MRAIARAHQDRSLADFEKALRDYKDGGTCLLRVRVLLFTYYLHYRIIIGPNYSLAPRRSIRYPP